MTRLNDARKSEPPALEDVRPQIEENLRNAAAREIIDTATDGVTVVIPDDLGIDPAILSERDLLEP